MVASTTSSTALVFERASHLLLNEYIIYDFTDVGIKDMYAKSLKLKAYSIILMSTSFREVKRVQFIYMI